MALVPIPDRHHRDATERWNLIPRRYAAREQAMASFVGHGRGSPRGHGAVQRPIGGMPARADGTHHEGAGLREITDALMGCSPSSSPGRAAERRRHARRRTFVPPRASMTS
jgi:hypothetical protein